MAKSEKFIQIAVALSQWPKDGPTLYALAEDGRVWSIYDPRIEDDAIWRPVTSKRDEYEGGNE